MKSSAARAGSILAGKYELIRLLGEGGMGQVYEARNQWTERRVAIKILDVEYTKQGEISARFLREARAATKVSHPNVVDVLDMGQEEDGTLYIVQEFLHGMDLRHLMDRRGRARPSDAVEIIVPILGALVETHRLGVVHRDIKPENIFLNKDTRSGQIIPTLIDFGIAKLINDNPLTKTGKAIGTAFYMSPEQARGAKDIDAQTDIWSVGAVLFELLSNRCPFMGSNYNEIISQILTEDVPSIDEFAPIQPDLTAVVAKALDKDRTKRYKRAQDFLGELLECDTTESGVYALPHIDRMPDGTLPSALARQTTVRGSAREISRPREKRASLLPVAVALAVGATGIAASRSTMRSADIHAASASKEEKSRVEMHALHQEPPIVVEQPAAPVVHPTPVTPHRIVHRPARQQRAAAPAVNPASPIIGQEE